MEKTKFRIANEDDREKIYRLRHEVYATELGQHPENDKRVLKDELDEFNVYIVALKGDELQGFVSITPPSRNRYSIDKYIDREELSFDCNDRLYEVRILTVQPQYRGTALAGLLMYSAFRWIESAGGDRVVAIGRREVLSVYLKCGLHPLDREILSGRVTFELMTATIREFAKTIRKYRRALEKLEPKIEWQLEIPFWSEQNCFHGGQFYESIGNNFELIEKHSQIVNADVLDAWFPPAPEVLEVLHDHLEWIVRTSPPTHCEGMLEAIAQSRIVPQKCLVPGAGSSQLIFLAFRHWISRNSKVLILDPTYGEYPFVLEEVIGCQVDRLPLQRQNDYAIDLEELRRCLDRKYDFVVLVNPNSPTGKHIPREELAPLLDDAPSETRIWIDETYVDYVSPEQSLEQFAINSENVIVCKSMSKAYALSGVRVAYLCASQSIASEIRISVPPWAVGFPGQIAVVKALSNLEYYRKRWEETAELRNHFSRKLEEIGLDVVQGVANFLMCHLSSTGSNAMALTKACAKQGVFLRDLSSLENRMGTHSLRIAVKDSESNERIVKTIRHFLRRD